MALLECYLKKTHSIEACEWMIRNWEFVNEQTIYLLRHFQRHTAKDQGLLLSISRSEVLTSHEIPAFVSFTSSLLETPAIREALLLARSRTCLDSIITFEAYLMTARELKMSENQTLLSEKSS